MTNHKRFHLALPAVALCLIAGSGIQAFAGTELTRSADDWEGHVSVGPAGCDYSDLQDAIDDGAAGGHGGHIGVHADYEMNGEYVMHQFAVWVEDPWIAGGFSSCNVGDLGSVSGRTTLDGDEQSRHFDVQYDVGETGSVRRLTLQNLELVNGSAPGGGALWIRGQHNRLVVEMVNTEIDLNDGGLFGGGIYIQPDETIVDTIPPGLPFVRPMLVLDDDSHVTRNSAAWGGGISCAADSADEITFPVVQAGAGLILENEATMHGGGIYAKNCNFQLRNRGEVFTFIPNGGIAFNEAGEYGGGVYAEDGSLVSLIGDSGASGDASELAVLLFANDAERGGAIHATGEDTEIVMHNTTLMSNSADYGGGLYLTSEATAEFAARDASEDAPCRPITSESGVTTIPPCNRILNNDAAEDGGAAHVRNGAKLHIRDTFLEDNSAASGAAARVENSESFGQQPNAELLLENTLVTGHEGVTLFHFGNGASTDINWSSIPFNDVTGFRFLQDPDDGFEAALSMTGTIVWEEDSPAFMTATGDASVALRCFIGYLPDELLDPAYELAFYSAIDPEFQAPGDDNYRLSSTSPAIDYCNDEPVPERDLDRRLRDVALGGDTTEAPNPHPDGIHDLGAFTGLDDQMFRDRFEQD